MGEEDEAFTSIHSHGPSSFRRPVPRAETLWGDLSKGLWGGTGKEAVSWFSFPRDAGKLVPSWNRSAGATFPPPKAISYARNPNASSAFTLLPLQSEHFSMGVRGKQTNQKCSSPPPFLFLPPPPALSISPSVGAEFKKRGKKSPKKSSFAFILKVETRQGEGENKNS